MDYFYAQVEELKDPSLKTKPVAIGSPHRRGVLCTSNYIAREFGVKSAMSSQVALSKCPQLVFVKPDFKSYKLISEKVFNILYEYTEKVEGISLDEAYLDVTDSPRLNNSATLIALEIKKRVYDETGLTCSVGISYNKFLAKYSSEYKKPNGAFVIPPNVSKEFIGNIKVRAINGVGKVCEGKLKEMDIYRLKDLWTINKWELEDRLGKFGNILWQRSLGFDNREVCSFRERKSLSVENTFNQDIFEYSQIEQKLSSLYIEFKRRIERYSEKEKSSLFVKIKYHDFDVTTIEKRFESMEYKEFLGLFKIRFKENIKSIRLIGIGVKFKPMSFSTQLSLPLDSFAA